MMIGSLTCNKGICHSSFVTGGPHPVQAAILEGKQYPTPGTGAKLPLGWSKSRSAAQRSTISSKSISLQTGSSFYSLRAKRHLCIRGTILGLGFFLHIPVCPKPKHVYELSYSLARRWSSA